MVYYLTKAPYIIDACTFDILNDHTSCINNWAEFRLVLAVFMCNSLLGRRIHYK